MGTVQSGSLGIQVGVGIRLRGAKGDGIWLVNQLQNLYPSKIYILYSEFKTNIRKIRRAKADELWDKLELSRNSIKNCEGGFADKVQEIMNYYADPSKRWENIRTQLLNSGISIHSVALLETAYVKSIIKNNPEIYTKLYGKVDLSNDNNLDAYDIIKSGSSIINTTISLLALI